MISALNRRINSLNIEQKEVVEQVREQEISDNKAINAVEKEITDVYAESDKTVEAEKAQEKLIKDAINWNKRIYTESGLKLLF
jgi:hypothetical protein